jgi:glycosyltransferase involved in cell wall biosynthesis
MASALPPVCARAGGAAGIVEHGRTGLLAHPRDPHDLAAQIEILLDQPETREAVRLEAFAFAQRQRWERIFDRLLASYEQVIAEYSRDLPIKRKKAA